MNNLNVCQWAVRTGGGAVHHFCHKGDMEGGAESAPPCRHRRGCAALPGGTSSVPASLVSRLVTNDESIKYVILVTSQHNMCHAC